MLAPNLATVSGQNANQTNNKLNQDIRTLLSVTDSPENNGKPNALAYPGDIKDILE